MPSIDLGTVSLNLTIAPGNDGLPQRNSVSLQDWITQTAQSAYRAAPRFDPPQLAPPLMATLISTQAGG
jgi:hypothetical protein